MKPPRQRIGACSSFMLAPIVVLPGEGLPRQRLGHLRQWAVRAASIFFVALLALQYGMAAPASALNYSGDWSNNDYVGYCSEVDGGYVASMQIFLSAFSNYRDRVDNYWGPNSHSALVTYQAARQIPGGADGCAGPNTWADLQNADSGPTGGFSYYSTCGWAARSLFVTAPPVSDQEGSILFDYRLLGPAYEWYQPCP